VAHCGNGERTRVPATMKPRGFREAETDSHPVLCCYVIVRFSRTLTKFDDDEFVHSMLCVSILGYWNWGFVCM
jgi:hypothetical protein